MGAEKTPPSSAAAAAASVASQPKKARAHAWTPFRDAGGLELCLMLLGLVCAVAAGAMLPYFFRSMGKTIDRLNTTMDVDETVVEMAVAGAVCLVLQSLACFSMEVVADRLTARVRCRYVSSVLSQSLEWFDLRDASSLSSRLDVRLQDVRDGIGMKLVSAPTSAAMFVGSLVIAFTSCWSITLFSLAGLLPSILCGAFMGFAMRQTAAKVNKALEEAGGVASETLSNIRTVAAFGGEDLSVRRYEALVHKAEKAGVWGGVTSGLGISGLIMSVFAMFALVFYLSGHKVADELQKVISQLPPGGEAVFLGPPSQWPQPSFRGGSAFVISISLLIAAFQVGNFSESLATFAKAVEAAADIYSVIDEPSKISSTSSEGLKDVPLDGDIVFDSVSFAYPSRPDFQVFKKFSLRIPAGKSVAFVGPSGCGKSTLLQLVQRLYDPKEGTVSVAGQ